MLSFQPGDFVVKQLYVEAHWDRLESIKGEVSSRTSGHSIVSDHPESEDKIFRETPFRLQYKMMHPSLGQSMSIKCSLTSGGFSEFVPHDTTDNDKFYVEVLKRLKRRVYRVRVDIVDYLKLHRVFEPTPLSTCQSQRGLHQASKGHSGEGLM